MFVIGLMIGGLIGVFIMCMLQINRDNELQRRINKAIEYIKKLISDEYGVSILISDIYAEFEPEWKDNLLKILKGDDSNE